MSPRRLAAALAAALAVALAGAAPVLGAGTEGTVTIRLVEVPTDQADDPRANHYLVDHVAPGAVVERSVEVRNGTGNPTTVSLYAGAATVEGDQFVFGEGRGGNELTSWTTVEPGSLTLAPGERAIARVTVRVPADADPGERYGVVWAELPAAGSDTLKTVNRVGVRIYLSAGSGTEPVSDFDVRSIEAIRTADGTPLANVAVANTGERALDLTAELRLAGGPGGISAGPFSTDAGTTLEPGTSTTLAITLPADLPAGPWEATAVVRSGLIERSAVATVEFPTEAGRSAGPVTASQETTSAPQRTSSKAPVAGVALGGAAAVSALAGTGMLVRARLLRLRGH